MWIRTGGRGRTWTMMASGRGGPNGLGVHEFSVRTGLEKHAAQFASTEVVLARMPGPFPQYQSEQWTAPKAFLTEKDPPRPDLSLKAGSAAIGAGVMVPNLMQQADGRAPDLGAWQFGQPVPHYGPR